MSAFEARCSLGGVSFAMLRLRKAHADMCVPPALCDVEMPLGYVLPARSVRCRDVTWMCASCPHTKSTTVVTLVVTGDTRVTSLNA
jgi:hypothetical protein